MLRACPMRKRRFRGFSLAATAALQVLLVVCVVPTWAAEGTGGSHVPSSEVSLLGEFDLEGLAFNREEIRAGGPGKDGIPALLNPETVPAARAGFLRPGDRVVAVSIGEESRAYPIRILNWHEAINDTVGGVPIAVAMSVICLGQACKKHMLPFLDSITLTEETGEESGIFLVRKAAPFRETEVFLPIELGQQLG